MKHTKFAGLGFVLTLVGSTLLLTSTLFAKTQESESSRLEALAKYTRVVSTIEKYYVDDINVTAIINKSIEGLMSNLDAHSSFLNKKNYKDLKIQTDGEFGGLGITVGMKNGALTVIAPIDGTPAYKAGVKAGDIILKINDLSTLGMTIDEAVGHMRGKPKTKIVLTVVRSGASKPIAIPITRDIITVDSVHAKTIENENILYLRVSSFSKNVVEEAKKALSSHRDVKGIILDLRNNPGGLLNQAVGLVDLFVDKGVIVSQKGRDANEDISYHATKSATMSRVPMTVLVNGGSASASEIVSGALQDFKRAVIIGEKTFGKGSVQVILPINNTEALRLTIARYYLPSGRTIQAVGVTPDVIVYAGKVPHKVDAFSIKEKELKMHLQRELAKIDKKKVSKEVSKKDVITPDEVENDIQLKTAIDAIKILSIKNNRN
ncbi:MAG: S41 family peptidase [Sulfurospirillaceae bacterium]|nr:S41 family peptidase [Sulfurospirillaceae bacterium]